MRNVPGSARRCPGDGPSRCPRCDNRRVSVAPVPASDLLWGAFSDDPPWVLANDQPSWRAGGDELRAAARREVPVLTKPAKWPPGLRVARVALRISAALLPWTVRKKAKRFASAEASRADISRRLRSAAEDLGPTYIKLGQIIS